MITLHITTCRTHRTRFLLPERVINRRDPHPLYEHYNNNCNDIIILYHAFMRCRPLLYGRRVGNKFSDSVDCKHRSTGVIRESVP